LLNALKLEDAGGQGGVAAGGMLETPVPESNRSKDSNTGKIFLCFTRDDTTSSLDGEGSKEELTEYASPFPNGGGSSSSSTMIGFCDVAPLWYFVERVDGSNPLIRPACPRSACWLRRKLEGNGSSGLGKWIGGVGCGVAD